MAQAQNNTLPPTISIPQAITTLMDGFSAESEKEARLIFEQAIRIIDKNSKLSKRDLKVAYMLYQMMNPQDDFERLGMNKLSQPSHKEKSIGLKLLKASKDAMERIHKRRNGSTS
jgi:hypothetical protein